MVMRVRATRDGVYAGVYRNGPMDGVPGIVPGADGEVFDIDDKLYPAINPDTGAKVMEPVLDTNGNPIIDKIEQQVVDEQGRPIIGPDKKPLKTLMDKPRMRSKMWTWFDSGWMEKVPSDTPLTRDEVISRDIHPTMKPTKKRSGISGVPATLSSMQSEIGKEIIEEPVI